jgi:hypothetical protein
VFQLKFTGNGTVFIDNIYFGREVDAEQNSPPEVALNVVQSSVTTTSVTTSDGVVTITANITDTNSRDSHTVEWSVSGVSQYSTDGNVLNFDPADLTVSQVTIVATVTDSGAPTLTGSASITLTVTRPTTPIALPPSGSETVPEPDSGGGGSTSLGLLFLLLGAATLRRQSRLIRLRSRLTGE